MKYEITINDEYYKKLDITETDWPELIPLFIASGACALVEANGQEVEEDPGQITASKIIEPRPTIELSDGFAKSLQLIADKTYNGDLDEAAKAILLNSIDLIHQIDSTLTEE